MAVNPEETSPIKGYIYILFNECYDYYGENVFKIGKAIDVAKRAHSYTTSYIKPIELKYISPLCNDYTLVENAVFRKLKDYRVVRNREFFQISPEEIVTAIESVVSFLNDGGVMDPIDETMRGNTFTNDEIEYIECVRNNAHYNSQYEDILTDYDNFKGRLNIVALFASDYESENETTSHKIKSVKELADKYDLQIENDENNDERIGMSDTMFQSIKKTFPCTLR